MGFSEDITRLRMRLNDLVRLEVIDNKNFRDFYQASMIEIITEIERKKRDIDKVIAQFKHQISKEEGRLMALEQAHSLVYAVVDGFCRKQERALEEDKSREIEVREKAEYAAKVSKELELASEKITSHSKVKDCKDK